MRGTKPCPKANSYAYDATGNLASVTDAGGTVSYARDAVGQLTALTDRRGRQISFSYDRNGNRLTTAYPNGITISRAYDASERLQSLSAKKPASGTIVRSFDYSASGTTDSDLRQSVTDTAGNTTSYAYDPLSRLTSADRRNRAGTLLRDADYRYDGNGNRTSKTINGATTSYAYNAADELTQATGANLAVDRPALRERPAWLLVLGEARVGVGFVDRQREHIGARANAVCDDALAVPD